MLTPELRTFLQAPLIARLSVIDSNGYPHTVPLWFDVDGNDIVIISDRKTRKVDYIKANSKASVCIGGGETAENTVGPGYLFKGECLIEEDPGFAWLRRMTLRYEQGEQAEKDIELWRTTLDMMVIRFKIAKISKVF
ncbi:MAG: pyridoxamine 5'-phosphate oxidase family protein [Anaerolineae bacterium]|nr:pyridoxamine 5'-phosphate oxidase family protein [Anaerolineae bacterium]NUQ02400.1 pyridoxamine 5'-phosphate oxidase family protein [Anaerolineae bacterium]